MSSDKARRLLFEPRELKLSGNNSLAVNNQKTAEENLLPLHKRLNMSMLIPNGSKYTSALPGNYKPPKRHSRYVLFSLTL